MATPRECRRRPDSPSLTPEPCPRETRDMRESASWRLRSARAGAMVAAERDRVVARAQALVRHGCARCHWAVPRFCARTVSSRARARPRPCFDRKRAAGAAFAGAPFAGEQGMRRYRSMLMGIGTRASLTRGFKEWSTSLNTMGAALRPDSWARTVRSQGGAASLRLPYAASLDGVTLAAAHRVGALTQMLFCCRKSRNDLPVMRTMCQSASVATR
jgi:hypothetical protein